MNQINWEVRDAWDFTCGWFVIRIDAEACRKGQAVPENYTIHPVNKTVKEND